MKQEFIQDLIDLKIEKEKQQEKARQEAEMQEELDIKYYFLRAKIYNEGEIRVKEAKHILGRFESRPDWFLIEGKKIKGTEKLIHDIDDILK